MAELSTVLITGHTGFIGKALTAALDHDSFKWTGASRSTGVNLEEFSALERLPACFSVVHLAARTVVPESWDNPEDFLRTNYLSTLSALKYARQHGARFIYMSSYLYGTPQQLPIDENHPVACLNPYMASKFAGELLCRTYADLYDIPTTILRPFNIYGPGQSRNNLIPHIIGQANDGTAIRVKDLKPRRDYLFIDDFVAAVMGVLQNQHDGFHIYNVGSGKSYSVQHVIETVQSILGLDLPVQSSRETRQNEIDDCVSNSDKIAADYGWMPRHDLKHGLSKTIERMAAA